jgi:hypothetical protein
MGIRSVVLGAGLIAVCVALVGETRNRPDVLPESSATALIDAPLGHPLGDAVQPNEMPLKLSIPIRCEQWIAQWGRGEMPRQRCVDADLRYRSAHWQVRDWQTEE